MKHSLMSPRKLRHVVALATNGSYVRAARTLNLSPSALSRSIQSVEDEMKVVLFTRGKGGVFPTPAGARVVDAAHDLLENLTRLQESFSDLGQAEFGETAIGLAPMPSALVLPQLFEQALKEGKLRIQVHVEAGAILLEMLNAGRIEFFIGTAGSIGRAANVKIEELMIVPIAARARHGHPLAEMTKVTQAEFSKFPLIGGNFEANARLNIRPARPYNPLLSCDNYHILADVVRGSDAICLFPRQFLTPGLVDLNSVPDVYRESAPLILCHLGSRRLSPAGVRVLDRIRDVISRLGLQPV